MTRKSGSAYPVNDAWRRRVETDLARRDPPWTRADLARESGLSRSTISELMNGITNECVRLPEIHHALGWLEPFPALTEREEVLLKAFRHLDDFGKGELTREAINLLQQQHARPANTTPKPKKPTRAIARAGMSLGSASSALRAADETPAEIAIRKRRSE